MCCRENVSARGGYLQDNFEHSFVFAAHSIQYIYNAFQVKFRPQWDAGRIAQVIEHPDQNVQLEADLIRVQCFPLHSFLVALNVSVVDFLSVDTEGDDLDVLKTLPFQKVVFRVITVEVVTAPQGPGPIRKFMESQGFKTAGIFYFGGKPCDMIFVHSSVEINESATRLISSKYYNKAHSFSP